MRVARIVPLALAASLALAACASEGGQPGWTYAPAPSLTPAPSGSPAESESPSEAPSEAPSGEPSAPASGSTGTTLELVAEGIAYDTLELSAPADQPFAIHFVQNDAGVGGHDVDIRTGDGTVVQDNEVLAEPGETTYEIEPLAAGDYVFICSIHPIAAMTGTLTVE